MTLERQTADFLRKYEEMKLPDFSEMTPEEGRAMSQKLFLMRPQMPPFPLASIENGKIAHVPVRIYTPKGKGPFPALVFFHGGGFVIGTLDQSDRFCQLLAHDTGSVVVSVDYRLAPEHPFPAGPEDCYAVTQEFAKRAQEFSADPHRIGVIGPSAGGTLAAAVALMARDRKGPKLKCQILIYPTLDVDYNTQSYLKYHDGYLLTRSSMIWFMNHYLPNEEDAQNPYACPLKAKDLSHLPPAFFALAECDPLHDEGVLYAKRLKEFGVSVFLSSYSGLIHGYCTMFDTIGAAKAAVHDMTTRIKGML